MKASKMIINTLKEAPVEAKISSHSLLLRAGMIKNLVSGVYNYMPFGLRVLNKIENIIREEMDNSGALEILSSAMQPKELWESSGRWSHYGPELFRFTDRHDHEFCLGPTHEEVFTTLAKDIIKSPKNLPVNLYQIQTKYRDEVRPRFGLMRSREFIMKDAYSFDKDVDGLEESYQNMYDTYDRIFTRFNLNYRAVLADTGNIGGNGSHQFMALSDVGESQIVYCDSCGYAADVEKAEAVAVKMDKELLLEKELVHTPNAKTIEEVAAFLKEDPAKIAKSLLYRDLENNRLVLVMVMGNREVNEIKLCNALNIGENFLTLASDTDIISIGSVNGFVGPVGLDIQILADYEIKEASNLVVGANQKDFHLINVNFGRDFTATLLDLRKAIEGDSCPICGAPMKMDRGIEVGQIFKLQTKYSQSMNCLYTNEEGKNVPMVMGCYGIGVTRTLASIVEQYHDEAGIKWPINVAPYEAVIVPINKDDEIQFLVATKMYEELKKKGIEVILDDRNAKPGFKFKDWELIGIPYMVVCGKRSNEDIVELKDRNTLEKIEVSSMEAISIITDIIKKNR